MTDLEAIGEAPVPRPDRLAQRFGRRIDPTWGFVLYGILYFFLVVNSVGVLPIVLVVSSYPGTTAPAWMASAWLVWYVISQVGLWWVFARWAKRRRGQAAALVRDGELVTGDVNDGVVSVRGVHVRPAIGFGSQQNCTVLFRPGARYCFVFAPDGTAVACGIGRGHPVIPASRESNVETLPEARIVE